VFVCGAVTPPSQRVQFIIGRDDEYDDEDHQAHAMFCEMEELRPSGEDGEKEWKEVARYVFLSLFYRSHDVWRHDVQNPYVPLHDELPCRTFLVCGTLSFM